MPSIIRVLDEKTINKIAAGEVIENSASCVKELIENALDAKATCLEIQITAGGRKKIEVIDNGRGMSPDDALLALERHATSKLKKIEDMGTLSSMGFRGEALASIASISKFHLCTSDGELATEIISHGGRLIKNEMTSRPQGTTIEVHSLFFNMPARQAFQKSVAYDVQEVTRMVTHLALANPHVGFRLVSDQKEIFNLIGQPSTEFLETTRYRIYELFGEEVASSLIEVNQNSEGIYVRGFVSQVETTRPNRLGQHFYINHRYVESKLISWAIQEGYSTRLAQRRFPLAFLFIQMDPQFVDVNVHPQKKEVRFKDPLTLKKVLSTSIDHALQKKSQPLFEAPKEKDQKALLVSNPGPHFEELSFSKDSVYDQVYQIKVPEREPHFSTQEPVLDCIPHVVGIFDRYIFVEAQSCQSALDFPQQHLDGLLVVHQKRAKERLLFDHLIKERKQVSIQNLLLPETIEYSRSDAALLESSLPLFNQLGVSIRSLKGTTFIIDGLPALLQTSDVRNIMELILEELRSFGFHGAINLEKEKILAQAIAKSVSFEKKIDKLNEAQILVQKLLRSENFLTSPKGKPIIKVLDQNDLSKLFDSKTK